MESTKGKVLIGRVILTVLFLVVYFKFQDYNADQRRALAKTAARDLFTLQHQQWVVDDAAYELCLRAVPVSSALRNQFFEEADRWDALANEIDRLGFSELAEKAREWADAIRDGSYLQTQPRSLSDCINPGPEPVYTQ